MQKINYVDLAPQRKAVDHDVQKSAAFGQCALYNNSFLPVQILSPKAQKYNKSRNKYLIS